MIDCECHCPVTQGKDEKRKKIRACLLDFLIMLTLKTATTLKIVFFLLSNLFFMSLPRDAGAKNT